MRQLLLLGLIFLTFCSHVGRINADLSEYGWENWHDITIEGNIHATIKFDFLEANKIEFPLGLKLSRNKKLDASNKASNNSLFVTNPTSKPLNVTFILKRMLNKLSALNGSVVSFWGMPLLRVSDHNFHLASKSSIQISGINCSKIILDVSGESKCVLSSSKFIEVEAVVADKSSFTMSQVKFRKVLVDTRNSSRVQISTDELSAPNIVSKNEDQTSTILISK